MNHHWKHVNGTAHRVSETGQIIVCANCSGTVEQHQKVVEAFYKGFDTDNQTTGTCPECEKKLFNKS